MLGKPGQLTPPRVLVQVLDIDAGDRHTPTARFDQPRAARALPSTCRSRWDR